MKKIHDMVEEEKTYKCTHCSAHLLGWTAWDGSIMVIEIPLFIQFRTSFPVLQLSCLSTTQRQIHIKRTSLTFFLRFSSLYQNQPIILKLLLPFYFLRLGMQRMEKNNSMIQLASFLAFYWRNNSTAWFLLRDKYTVYYYWILHYGG
jgi:hypothetical protein